VVCCAPGELNDVQYSIQILDSPVGLAPDGVSFLPLSFHNSHNTLPGTELLILLTLHLSVQRTEQFADPDANFTVFMIVDILNKI